MVRVSGPLVNVTTSASSVRDVQVHTKKVRAWGDGLMTPDPSQATLSNGVVEFEAAPGPVVMVLFMAEAGAETVSLVVGEGATQSLADAYRDGQMASDRDADELAGILEQIRESVGASAEARAGAEAAAEDAAGSAASAGRDADRAEEAEAGAVEAEEGAEAGQELSEDAAAVAVAAAVGAAEASSDKADIGHKHGSGDISEKTVSIGNPADQYKMLYLDVNGRLQVDTSAVTLERDVASKGYVDSRAWGQGLVPTSVTSLDQLIDGLHSVANAGVAGSLGIPGRATGTLQMMTIANGKTAFYLSGGTEPALYINARSGGVWSGWKQVYPTTAGTGGSVDKAYVDSADQALGTRITNEKWKKTLVPTSATGLDSLADGMWGVGNGGVSRTLGIPGAPYGSLQVQTVATGRTALFITQDEVPRVYVTAKSGGVWGEWEKVFPTDVPPESKYAAGGLKTVPLALSTGISGDGVTSGRWRTLAHFGAPITRWRLRISNVSPVWGTSRGGFTLGEVTVGAHTGDGQMTTTRVLNAGARQVADGDEWVSEWVSGIDLQDEHLIDFAFDGATSTYLALGTGWDMSTGTPTPTNRMALWTWLEAETYQQTPAVALIGDSTGAGVGADRPVYESALAIVGRERGFLPVLYAHSGDTLEGNPGIEDFNFQRWRDFPAPDSIIIQAGSNDLHAGGADLAEMQRRYAATAEAAHQIAPVVIGATVKPRFPNHPEYDQNRVAFNQWLHTQPEGIRDVLPFAEVLAPDGSLPAEYNADGSHINTAGYLKMAEAFEGVPLSRPAYNPDPAPATEIDTGWRSLTPLDGEGRVLIRRVGKHVTVSVQDWESAGEYAVHIALLPNGFRPTGKKFFMAASHTWAFKPSIIGMYSGSYVSWLRSVDGTYTRPTAPQSGEITFLTDDPEPAIYPGTPA